MAPNQHGAATALQQPAGAAAAAAAEIAALQQELPARQLQELMKGHDQEVSHLHEANLASHVRTYRQTHVLHTLFEAITE